MAKQQSMRILSNWGDPNNGRPRNYYLWAFQLHYAIDVKLVAKSLFKQLDQAMVPDTLLVAVNTEAGSSQPLVVVEPEDHDFQPNDFANVLHLADQLEKAAPGPSFGYPVESKAGEAWAKQEERKLYCARIGDAVARTIEGASADCTVYVSPGRPLGQYFVFSVLMIDRRICDSHPSLHRTSQGDVSVITSLINAVARQFVETCWTAILSSFAGQGHSCFPTTDSMLRAAGSHYMYTPFGACDNFDGLHGGFEACNEISTLTYEKAIGRGRLILAKVGHENVAQTITLRNPPKLRDYRAVRKLLQLAQGDEGLICDSHRIRGIGTVIGNYDTSKEDLFCVEFLGHSKWELTHNGIPLIRVEHGIPKLPMKQIQIRRFMATFDRCFPSADERHRNRIRRIATAATAIGHGMVLIVTQNASEEAIRFGSQATLIEPVELTDDLLERASRIDGAMLVSPDGICHAIGVILDGRANERGIAERGARFNSTVRYVYGSDSHCIGWVVSDDGMVDTVPQYRPTMSRCDIQELLDELQEISEATSVNQRKMNRAMERITGCKFYLSKAQCELVNRLISDAEPKSDKSAAWCIYSEFQPHPDMNDTFLGD